MNTASAIFLFGVIVAFLVLDAVFFGSDGLLFLARRFADMTEWLAFWR
ncbi:MAG: hypothetical protein NXH79_00355 [Rhodobacteraceae bacterium]|jgi:hypothetical protein|nr:hypothetical protein [Paracoccaceae bacterium]